MFKTFASFADFDGCRDGQHLWCFDCHAHDASGWRQNRTWAVSDLPEDEVRRLAEKHAHDAYGHALAEVSFFDPSGPDIDYMGNFGEWYADDDHKALFMEACRIEASITDDMRDHQRDHLRTQAIDMLLQGGLKANMCDIEGEPMLHVIRDVLNDAAATHESAGE